MKGLNSFLEVQEIDFEKLTSSGTFGIFGPTRKWKNQYLDGIDTGVFMGLRPETVPIILT